MELIAVVYLGDGARPALHAPRSPKGAGRAKESWGEDEGAGPEVEGQVAGEEGLGMLRC